MDNNSSSLRPDLRWANFRSSAGCVWLLKSLYRKYRNGHLHSPKGHLLKKKVQENREEVWVFVGCMSVCAHLQMFHVFDKH